MIHHKTKTYQIDLWSDAERRDPATRLEFDVLEEAQEAFTRLKAAGRGTGILIEWHTITNEWILLDKFPG